MVELLDLIARKGVKGARRSLIRRSLRPKDRAKRQPVSMRDPKALAFFPRKPGTPPPGS